MNVFVLSTGRCGSMAFARACEHITNYTSAHESRTKLTGTARLDYPENHIESDNRLSWYPGRLEALYGDDAFYVHLKRERRRVVESYVKREHYGIMRGFRGVLTLTPDEVIDAHELAREICDTVITNIEYFLRDKSKCMAVDIAEAERWFPEFWERIGAEGDLEAALGEFSVRHNATPEPVAPRRPPLWVRLARKGKRVVTKAPQFILDA